MAQHSPPESGQVEATTEVRLTAETKDVVLGKLRHAVAFQIGLWDTALEIAGMVDTDLELVLEWVNATSIVADSGLELGARGVAQFGPS